MISPLRCGRRVVLAIRELHRAADAPAGSQREPECSPIDVAQVGCDHALRRRRGIAEARPPACGTAAREPREIGNDAERRIVLHEAGEDVGHADRAADRAKTRSASRASVA